MTLGVLGDLTQTRIAARFGLSQMHVSRLLSRTPATPRAHRRHRPPATRPRGL